MTLDEAELRRRVATGHDAHAQLSRIEAEARRTENARLIGQFFRYRNCYSCPETDADYWWAYAVVTRLDDDGRPWSFQFERDKNGDVSIQIDKPHVARWEPCGELEFERAWRDIVDGLPRNPRELAK
jgi:hypothetical protein